MDIKFLRAISGFAALFVVSAISVAPAYATPIEITGSYSVSYSKSNSHQNQPTFTYSLNPSSSTGFLTPGVSTGALDFFTINPSHYCGDSSNHRRGCTNNYTTQSGTITVDFNFTEIVSGATATLSESGLYQAKYSGSYLACSGKTGYGQSDCINWETTTPIPVSFTNGDILNVTFYDAEDWSIRPMIGFELTVPTKPRDVPLPGTLPLFAGGLAGLAFLRMRKKRGIQSRCQ